MSDRDEHFTVSTVKCVPDNNGGTSTSSSTCRQTRRTKRGRLAILEPPPVSMCYNTTCDYHTIIVYLIDLVV